MRGTISANTKEEIRDHTYSIIRDIKDHIYNIEQIEQGIMKEQKEKITSLKF